MTKRWHVLPLFIVFGVCLPINSLKVLADSISVVKPKPRPPAEKQYQQGVSALAKGELDNAEAAFNESLKLDPDQISSMLGLADVALQKGQATIAGGHLKKALAKAPNNSDVQRGWGRYLFSRKDFGASETALKKAIALTPKAASPHSDLGDLYLLGFKKPDLAIQSYRSALALDPNHPAAHYGLGLALAATKQTEAALIELENTLKLKPDFVQARVARGDLLLAKGETAKGITEYQLAQKTHPSLAQVQLKLGIAYEKGGQSAEAEKAYVAAISLDPKQAAALNNLAWLCAERRQRLDEAVFWAKRAVALDPASSQFYDTLGWVHRARGESEKARAALEKACGLSPKLPEAFYHLGIVSQEMAQPKAAQKALQAALTLNKEFAGASDARKRLESLSEPRK